MAEGRVKQPLYVDVFSLEQMRQAAERRDLSISAVVAEAWDRATTAIAAMRDAPELARALLVEPRVGSMTVEDHHGGRDSKVKQNVHFSTETLQALKAEAGRLDTSLSQLIKAAWVLGRDPALAAPRG